MKNRGLVRVEATNADRVRSRVLGAWLRAVGEGDGTRLRLASGSRGEELFPTDAERAERAEAELETERAAREQAEAARERAEAEVERLRAQLRRRG